MYPSIAPRSNRSTELVKEFARQGFDVTIYAVLGKYDYSQFEKEYNVNVKDLGPTVFAKLNSDGKDSSSFVNRLLKKVFRRSIEFPDIELMFRTNRVLKKENNIDLLITVAVPYPIHWGAAFRKMFDASSFPKTWVADCGDPYMGNKFLNKPFYFKFIEKWFCKKADYISIPIEDAKEAYYPEFRNKIKIIPQGFDFSDVPSFDKKPNNIDVTFIYAGVFYPGIRDPRPFLDYLVSKKDKPFLFKIYTKSLNVVEPYLDLLGEKLEVNNYIPREELLKEMAKADFLINFENNTAVQSPSKLIDYALVQRPILSINSSDKLDGKIIDEFLNRNYSDAYVVKNIEKYNIKNVVSEFLNLLPR